jgi:hypothetical protein
MPAKRKQLIVNQGVLKTLRVESVDRRAPRTFALQSFAPIRVIRGQSDRWRGNDCGYRLLPLAKS